MRPSANHPSANQGKGHTHDGAVKHPRPIWTVLLAIVFLMQLYLTLGCAYERKKKQFADEDAATLTGPADDTEDISPSSKPNEGEQTEAPALAPTAAYPSIDSPPSSSYPQGQGHPPIRPDWTLWLAPYLTARWHKVAALAAYLATLGVQLLDAWWIKGLLARMTADLFRTWLNLARSGRWFPPAIFSLVVGVGLALDMFALLAGALVVWFQFLCIVELYFFARY